MLDGIPVFCLDGWNTCTESRKTESGSFFIKVYSGASPKVSQAISPTDSPLTRFCWVLFFFFVISSGSPVFFSPCRHPMAFLHTPYALLRIWESHFHWDEQKCSIQFPNLILALREMVLFFISLNHVHVHTDTHTNGPYHAVLLPKAMVMHFHFILNLFVCSHWPSMIHDHKRERTHSESTWNGY